MSAAWGRPGQWTSLKGNRSYLKNKQHPWECLCLFSASTKQHEILSKNWKVLLVQCSWRISQKQVGPESVKAFWISTGEVMTAFEEIYSSDSFDSESRNKAKENAYVLETAFEPFTDALDPTKKPTIEMLENLSALCPKKFLGQKLLHLSWIRSFCSARKVGWR